MPDGTVYAGISPDTGKALYTTPGDVRRLAMRRSVTWQQAMGYGRTLDAHGHEDWRVPTIRELRVLFNNPAAIGGFVQKDPDSFYWSSMPYGRNTAWAKRFCSGREVNFGRHSDYLFLRCVRG